MLPLASCSQALSLTKVGASYNTPLKLSVWLTITEPIPGVPDIAIQIIVVELALTTMASIPASSTCGSLLDAIKLSPLITTRVPSCPLDGVTMVILPGAVYSHVGLAMTKVE